jgi:ornithine cyclodeaminase/alanine dehydrogenase-like protein (mu-crystallin family)
MSAVMAVQGRVEAVIVSPGLVMLDCMLLLDAAALRARLPYGPLVQALRARFVAGCEVPPRQVHAVAAADGSAAGSVLVMPAWRAGGRLGIKVVNVFPGNGARGLPGLHGVYTLFDATTGVALAQLDGTELTTRRTVAASALAASYLARSDARRLLVVGAGRLATEVAAAMAAVRPGLDEAVVWARRPEQAEALVAGLQAAGWRARVAASLAAEVARADIVSCATLATTPLVQGAWLRPGTHVDLMGAFTPAMREVDGDAVARARVFVDTDEALQKSGDLVLAQAEGRFDPAQRQGTLASLCRGETRGRCAEDEITLFKSVGTALEDLAAAELAFDHASPLS